MEGWKSRSRSASDILAGEGLLGEGMKGEGVMYVVFGVGWICTGLTMAAGDGDWRVLTGQDVFREVAGPWK